MKKRYLYLDEAEWRRLVFYLNEFRNKLFAQGLMAAVANAVTTAIVGSLLCVAYAATRTKAGSLNKEN